MNLLKTIGLIGAGILAAPYVAPMLAGGAAAGGTTAATGAAAGSAGGLLSTTGGKVLAGLAGGQVVSSLVGAKQQQKAAEFQKEAQKQQTALQVEQNRRSVMQSLREARIRSALISQTALNTGARGSGEAGAIGSITTQFAGNIGNQRVQAQSAMNTSNFLAKAATYQSNANLADSFSRTFQSLFQMGRQEMG